MRTAADTRLREAMDLLIQAADMLRSLTEKNDRRTEADIICERVAEEYDCLPADITGEACRTRGNNKMVAARSMFGYILYKKKYSFGDIGKRVNRERTWAYDAVKRVEDFISIKDRLYYPQWENLKTLTSNN